MYVGIIKSLFFLLKPIYFNKIHLRERWGNFLYNLIFKQGYFITL